jgi:hypothetical protein
LWKKIRPREILCFWDQERPYVSEEKIDICFWRKDKTYVTENDGVIRLHIYYILKNCNHFEISFYIKGSLRKTETKDLWGTQIQSDFPWSDFFSKITNDYYWHMYQSQFWDILLYKRVSEKNRDKGSLRNTETKWFPLVGFFSELLLIIIKIHIQS